MMHAYKIYSVEPHDKFSYVIFFWDLSEMYKSLKHILVYSSLVQASNDT